MTKIAWKGSCLKLTESFILPKISPTQAPGLVGAAEDG